MQTEARITRQGKKYEILVDLDEALKIRKGEDNNIGAAVLTSSVFYNLKSGDVASTADLENNFGTSNFDDVCFKIIRDGEVVLPAEYLRKMQEGKYKQVVDFLSKNAVSPHGTPYTPDRIMTALKEANVSVKNVPIEKQISEIISSIQRIIPIKIDSKKIRVTIPAQFTGRAYGVITEFKQDEEWLSNGDLRVVVSVPAGLVMDFFDKLNGVTHGSALTEEIKN